MHPRAWLVLLLMLLTNGCERRPRSTPTDNATDRALERPDRTDLDATFLAPIGFREVLPDEYWNMAGHWRYADCWLMRVEDRVSCAALSLEISDVSPRFYGNSEEIERVRRSVLGDLYDKFVAGTLPDAFPRSYDPASSYYLEADELRHAGFGLEVTPVDRSLKVLNGPHWTPPNVSPFQVLEPHLHPSGELEIGIIKATAPPYFVRLSRWKAGEVAILPAAALRAAQTTSGLRWDEILVTKIAERIEKRHRVWLVTIVRRHDGHQFLYEVDAKSGAVRSTSGQT